MLDKRSDRYPGLAGVRSDRGSAWGQGRGRAASSSASSHVTEVVPSAPGILLWLEMMGRARVASLGSEGKGEDGGAGGGEHRL